MAHETPVRRQPQGAEQVSRQHHLFTAADGSVATIKEMKMNRMLCGYLDDPRQWDEPEAIEEEGLLTDAEQRIEWLFDSWADAVACDTYDEWHTVKSEIYGATQTLNAIGSLALRGVDPREELRLLGGVAFENSLVCIREGKYEGAPA